MITTFISDFFLALRAYLQVPDFIREHKLWSGFTRHRLVLVALAVVSVVFGMTMWYTVYDWWSNLEVDSALDAGAKAAGLLGSIVTTGYEFVFAGAYKYIVLIIMELLIFHLAIRTNEVLIGKGEELTAAIFIKAQIRMIKVVIFVFIMELLLSIPVSIGLGIIGLSAIKPVLLFLIQCFFLGYALIDNYYEINNLAIKGSFAKTKMHPGAATGIGLILYVLILIPLIGPIVGPMVGAIAATLTMYSIEHHQSLAEMLDDPETL